MELALMIYIVAFAIIFFSLHVEGDSFFDYFGSFVISVIISLMATFVIILLLFGIIVAGGEDKQKVLVNEYNLVGMKDNTNYVIGKYSNEEESMKYYYFTQEDDGGIVQKKAISDDSKIFEGNESPHVKIYQEKWIGTNSVSKYLISSFSNGTTLWEFHIPEGSVTQEFDIDLE